MDESHPSPKSHYVRPWWVRHSPAGAGMGPHDSSWKWKALDLDFRNARSKAPLRSARQRLFYRKRDFGNHHLSLSLLSHHLRCEVCLAAVKILTTHNKLNIYYYTHLTYIHATCKARSRTVVTTNFGSRARLGHRALPPARSTIEVLLPLVLNPIVDLLEADEVREAERVRHRLRGLRVLPTLVRLPVRLALVRVPRHVVQQPLLLRLRQPAPFGLWPSVFVRSRSRCMVPGRGISSAQRRHLSLCGTRSQPLSVHTPNTVGRHRHERDTLDGRRGRPLRRTHAVVDVLRLYRDLHLGFGAVECDLLAQHLARRLGAPLRALTVAAALCSTSCTPTGSIAPFTASGSDSGCCTSL